MESSERANWRLNIEDAARRAEAASGINCVRDIFSMFGASGLEDLPESSYEQAFSELILLASD